MADEIDPEPEDVEWVSLTKAFNDVGRRKFGVDWDKDTIYLSEGRFRENAWDEGLLVRIDYSAKYTHPEEWGDIWDSMVEADLNFAPEEMIEHFDKTEELLLTAIWDEKIKVEAINKEGVLSEVPRKAWKNKTKAFEISYPDSEVRNREGEGPWETWEIRVNQNDLQDFLEVVDAERRDAVRRRAANENPNKGGAPYKYDWPGIEQYITEALRKSETDVSNTAIARLVEKRLTDDGIDPPVDSALRECIKKVRETG